MFIKEEHKTDKPDENSDKEVSEDKDSGAFRARIEKSMEAKEAGSEEDESTLEKIADKEREIEEKIFPWLRRRHVALTAGLVGGLAVFGGSAVIDHSVVQGAPPIVEECTTPSSRWVWCDDFEKDRLSSYEGKQDAFIQDRSGFYRSKGLVAGSSGLPVSLTKAVGQTPYYIFSGNTSGNFRDIYWRFYVRKTSDFQSTDQSLLSKASVLAPNGIEAASAEIAMDKENFLHLRSFSGTDQQGRLIKTNNHVYDPVKSKKAVLTSGSWHCVEAHVQLNSAGNSNGVFELWVNGELMARQTDVNWLGSYEEFGINHISLNNHVPEDHAKYFDNFVVSTAPVGCGENTPTSFYTNYVSVSSASQSNQPPRVSSSISVPAASSQSQNQESAQNEQTNSNQSEEQTPQNNLLILSAVPDSSTQVTISWLGYNNSNNNIAGYRIIRNGSFIDHISRLQTSYTDSNLSPNTVYVYEISAFDINGNELARSGKANVRTASLSNPPSSPAIVEAEAVDRNTVKVSWTISRGDKEIAYYEVYKDGELSFIVSNRTYQYDSNINPFHTYVYKVRGVDVAGNKSGFSHEVSVRTN